MLDKTKCDEKLGKEVNKHLIKQGVQTPMLSTNISPEVKINSIRKRFNEIMIDLGLDLSDDSLIETPKRVAKMFVNELFWGLDSKNFPKCTTVENKMHYDEMVIEKNIKVASDCEHHFRTIWGKAHIAYIPKKKVLGLSKLNRIVEYFSKRPQIQERLTEQIYFALEYILGTKDIAIIIEAEHFCVKQRGVEDTNSSTITSKLGGKFMKNDSVRQEFIRLIKG